MNISTIQNTLGVKKVELVKSGWNQIEVVRGLKNLKTEVNLFLKNQKICSTVKRLSSLLIEQPEEQEVA